CIRRKFGSIIVKDDRIVSTGYVGAPRGRVNCCDRGTCYREENNIPSGTRYELCRSIHSEMNAIINASKEEMIDSTMYLVGVENDGTYTKNADCCAMCKRAIINSGISKVIIRIDDIDFKIIDVNDWIINDDSLDIDHQGY
ncbi:MAG: cytidine deaminase, partial [Clostridia bacterium]|nr:cytidine deaminase [Clostridia bacterium]